MPQHARCILALIFSVSCVSANAQPVMPHEGYLYFHRYSSYEAWDGEIWRYDLASGKGEYLSENWPVDHAMNVRFDRDRKRMLFMGVEPDQHYSDAWDVYLWQVDSKEPPINLTKRNGLRDEDPQFSPDGREILFKQSGSLAVMNVKTREVNKLTPNFLDEQSMPIYLDANRIVFMQGEAGNSSIRMYHRKTGRMQTIVDTPETQDYFPVPWDARRFLFVRWVSPVDHHDQVYQWNLAAREQTKLPFCQQAHDYSDPFPIDDRRVLFSSTRDGGKGGYDLYLGDADDGTLTPIDLAGVNTPAEELASVYVPPMKK